ncbi:MAG: ornithine--oxo-acid transaminase [Silvanigrellaceae bacterium]
MADMNLPLSELGRTHIQWNDEYGAHNYHPIPVVLARGEAEWVWDVDGKRYLDMLSAYSAVNQGHVHPRMMETLVQQAARITLTSRAFYNDQLGPWLKELTRLCSRDRALPMNSGAEAVETAVKLARKWGYRSKKVPHDQAEIIVCDSNFHGRTTMIVGFSSDPQYRADFGPFTGGFKIIPYGDSKALESAITPNTVGFLVEPIQGEAGVIVPPAGYLAECDRICKKNNVLFMVDEIQTGLCRTGKMFCHEHEDCKPDLLILGKALGGGFYPISAVVGDDAVLGLLKPGDHGSTFGGNPLACALSRTALKILQDENLAKRAGELGELFRTRLSKTLPASKVKEVRGKGLLNAIELTTAAGPARIYSEQLALRGVLAKETRSTTIRFAPPLVISRESIEWAMTQIEGVFAGQ